jgi:hypothetical protein
MPVIIPYKKRNPHEMPASPEARFDATSALPEYLRNMLLDPPKQGTGLHKWIFSCVRCLVRHRTAEEIQRIMHIAGAGTGRDISREIRESLRNAWTGDGPRPVSASVASHSAPENGWPARNTAIISALDPVTPSHWAGISPSSLPNASSAVSTLFHPSELLCMASKPFNAKTAKLEEWLPVCDSLPFMVASPMTALTGVNLSGKQSARCIANTGLRRYAVVEFDHDSPETQLACIKKLAEVLPVTLILHSGGKSYHAWFYVEHLEPKIVVDFLCGAAILGADPAVFVRCQLVRIPGGLREPGVPQPVIYFDPSTLPS